MAEKKPKKPGIEAERLKIDGDWKEAVRQVLRKKPSKKRAKKADKQK